MSESSALLAAIHDAQAFLADVPPPSNEPNTCDWVIRPLLLALGYATWDIHAQSPDVSSKFPDYTILPNSDATWYLEAKSWSVGLDSSHVDQAMNYAHSNGRRWVVLSNGREWRLYDDTIQGVSSDRHVATAMLDDEVSMSRFLTALCKESMLSNKVIDFASERRLRDFITKEIQDSKSAVIASIVRTVKSSLPGVPVSNEAIVNILNGSLLRSDRPQMNEARLTKPLGSVISAQASSNDPGEIDIICRGPAADARGIFREGGVLLRTGSRFRATPVASYASVFERRVLPMIEDGTLRRDGESLVLCKDLFCKTPSSAADLVLARSSNGWECWFTLDGRTLNSLVRRSRQ